MSQRKLRDHLSLFTSETKCACVALSKRPYSYEIYTPQYVKLISAIGNARGVKGGGNELNGLMLLRPRK